MKYSKKEDVCKHIDKAKTAPLKREDTSSSGMQDYCKNHTSDWIRHDSRFSLLIPELAKLAERKEIHVITAREYAQLPKKVQIWTAQYIREHQHLDQLQIMAIRRFRDGCPLKKEEYLRYLDRFIPENLNAYLTAGEVDEETEAGILFIRKRLAGRQ